HLTAIKAVSELYPLASYSPEQDGAALLEVTLLEQGSHNRKIYVYGVNADGNIYFTTGDLGHLLGYRNVSNMLTAHLETKLTMNDLLVEKSLKCPKLKRSPLIEFSDVPSLLHRVTLLSELVELWFQRVEAGKLRT
ncbi:hypothetical protein TNCT_615821, partial [Trichonephila clavata]